MTATNASRLEVNFRRLLRSCERIALTSSDSEMKTEDRKKFNVFLETLQNQLISLKELPSRSIPDDQLLEYARKIKLFGDMHDRVKTVSIVPLRCFFIIHDPYSKHVLPSRVPTGM